MAKTNKSTALYPHPFSKAYWRDALAEMKDIKMLVAYLISACRGGIFPPENGRTPYAPAGPCQRL